QLQYGAQIRDAGAGVLGVQSASGISVDTGALNWSANKQAAGGYRVALSQGGKELLGNAQLVLTNADGKVFTTDFAPDEISFEENGAQRAVVLMRGALGN